MTLFRRLLRACLGGPESPEFTAPPRHADLTKYAGAAVSYRPGMGPMSYDEATAVRAAKRAQHRTETGRRLPKPRKAKRRRATVLPIRRQG